MGKGKVKVDVLFKGSNKFNPYIASQIFPIHKSGNSMEYYYDEYNWGGDNLLIDEFIYDNYWDMMMLKHMMVKDINVIL